MNEPTLGALLDQRAAATPAHEALVYGDRPLRYSYQRLREGCDRIARGLLRIGIRPGEHVALWAGNLPECIILQLALAKLGAVAVPLPVPLSAEVLERLIRHADTRALLVGDSASVDKVEPETEILKSLIPELEVCPAGQLHAESFPELRSIVNIGRNRHPGMYEFEDLIDLAELVPKEELVRIQKESGADDAAAIFCDLHAPAHPLRTTLTHRYLVQKAQAVGKTLEARAEDRILLSHPLFDIYGSVCGSTLALVSGATLLLLADWHSRGVVRTTDDEQATILVGTASRFEHLLNEWRTERVDLEHLRAAVVIGPASPEFVDDLEEELGFPEITTDEDGLLFLMDRGRNRPRPWKGEGGPTA